MTDRYIDDAFWKLTDAIGELTPQCPCGRDVIKYEQGNRVGAMGVQSDWWFTHQLHPGLPLSSAQIRCHVVNSKVVNAPSWPKE